MNMDILKYPAFSFQPNKKIELIPSKLHCLIPKERVKIIPEFIKYKKNAHHKREKHPKAKQTTTTTTE